MQSVLVFDFLSHDFMHHPFNEAYLRMLRAGFPDDDIVFHARSGHLSALSPRFTAADRITFRPVEPFTIPFGLSRHNPLAGRVAAWRCWRSMVEDSRGRQPRLVSVLGFDANLLSVLRRVWPSRDGSVLHLILHNHFAGSVSWRSRNPLARAFDLMAGLQQPLPSRVRLIVLELGIREAIGRLIPSLAGSIDTLEHPILESEWRAAKITPCNTTTLKIAFLGHASLDKGFGQFAAWARENRRADLEFHAVGLASREEIDLRGLAHPPSPVSLSREEYTAALQPCDVACLPLSPIYDYVASGSVIDAVAGLKPLFSVKNNSLLAMTAKYGSFGQLAENMEDLRASILGLDWATLAAHRDAWLRSLERMRDARRPEALAGDYVRAIARLG